MSAPCEIFQLYFQFVGKFRLRRQLFVMITSFAVWMRGYLHLLPGRTQALFRTTPVFIADDVPTYVEFRQPQPIELGNEIQLSNSRRLNIYHPTTQR